MNKGESRTIHQGVAEDLLSPPGSTHHDVASSWYLRAEAQVWTAAPAGRRPKKLSVAPETRHKDTEKENQASHCLSSAT
jgi:hypothetical protein